MELAERITSRVAELLRKQLDDAERVLSCRRQGEFLMADIYAKAYVS